MKPRHALSVELAEAWLRDIVYADETDYDEPTDCGHARVLLNEYTRLKEALRRLVWAASGAGGASLTLIEKGDVLSDALGQARDVLDSANLAPEDAPLVKFT